MFFICVTKLQITFSCIQFEYIYLIVVKLYKGGKQVQTVIRDAPVLSKSIANMKPFKLFYWICISFHLSAIFPAGETKKTWPEWQWDPETSTRNSQLYAAGGTRCLSKW